MAEPTGLADIDAQIAALNALRAKQVALAEEKARALAKEKENILVDVTPTKKAKREEAPPSPPKQPAFTKAPTFKKASLLVRAREAAGLPAPRAFTAQLARPSTLAANMALRRSAAPRQELPSLRSSGFSERVPAGTNASGIASGSASASASASTSGAKAAAVASKGKEKATFDDSDLEVVRTGRERDDDLTVLDNLPLGPREFGLDPEGEEVWRALEPNSGIRLSKRVLPHDEVQDLLYGRYHLRPPQVYSVARLSRDGSTYDIPVDGDWVTIAVVAERSDIRVSGMRDVVSDEEDDEEDNDGKDKVGDKSTSKLEKAKAKNKAKSSDARPKKRTPRKFINLRLVGLPPRTKTLGSGASSSGDAVLSLLLFEADAIVHENDGAGGKKRTYRGGSGGAYEKWCNLGVGSVIAILNPRVLRPLKSGGGVPHPLTHPLALNPQNDDSIQLIGHAMDIGQCQAMQRDGTRCKSWVDTRLSAVCEYHIHAQVKRNRSTRAEFASATSRMDLEVRPAGSKPRFGSGTASGSRSLAEDYGSYNPRLKRGLLPSSGAGGSQAAPRGLDNGGGGATYIVGTGIARTGADGPTPSFGDQFLAERLGRSQAAKRKRKLEEEQADAAMAKIFERAGDDNSPGAKNLVAAGKLPARAERHFTERKRVFDAAAIRRIGFDPTGRRDEDADKRGASIASLKEASNRPVRLGRPPGPKKLSNVVVPPAVPARKPTDEDDMIDLD